MVANPATKGFYMLAESGFCESPNSPLELRLKRCTLTLQVGQPAWHPLDLSHLSVWTQHSSSQVPYWISLYARGLNRLVNIGPLNIIFHLE
jgi:hypothetical protein